MKDLLDREPIIKKFAITVAAIVIFILFMVFNFFIQKQQKETDQIRLEKQIEEVKQILKIE
jgi:preprotein translocase subunit YajC